MSNMTDNVENEDENILKELFRKCDAEIRTGHVKAVDLINAIQVNKSIHLRTNQTMPVPLNHFILQN